MKEYILIIMLIMLVFFNCACSEYKEPEKAEGDVSSKQKNTETNMDSLPRHEDTDSQNPIEGILSQMTLEEKVGQVFITAFRSNSSDKPMQELDNNARKVISDYCLGGVVLFSENIHTIQQTANLIKDMQMSSKIPLFIAVDEEGGIVSRLNSSDSMHATKLPGNMAVGRTQNPQLAYEVGRIIGREIGALGFNIDFAPVADVNTNPENPVIGDRSFGSDPDTVALMVEAMVKGIQDQNVSAVLKHFPGHGDTSFDTHTGEVVVEHGKDRLETVEFVPFKKGIEAEVDGIMTAHIQVPKITGNNIPATMSEEILTGILRDELNFKGIIITDALEMGAISKYWSSGEASVKAFKAGADILLMPASLSEAYNALLEAVRQGEISEERLDESVRRILTVKQRRSILSSKDKGANAEQILGNQEHIEIADRIKKEAKIN
ncbi:MAG: glycoside hydrolase family 3 protein [Acetivibrionales bacterium]|jgi:beta-N-acetylhexosaminidase